jgi:hypothetical protein
MLLMFYHIREKKPDNLEKVWCIDDEGTQFPAIYYKASRTFADLETGDIRIVRAWSYFL